MQQSEIDISDEAKEVLKEIEVARIERLHKLIKIRIVCLVIFIVITFSATYLLYYKIENKIYDLNFYLILLGGLYSLSLVVDWIKKLLPKNIEREKQKIYDTFKTRAY